MDPNYGGYPIRWAGDVRLLDGTKTAEIDRLGWLVTLEEIHHQVHEGELFTASDVQASAAPIYWIIINPGTTKEYHKRNFFISDAAGRINIYHDANIGTFAKGTQFYAYNNNQIVGGTSTLQFWAVPAGLTGTGNLRFSSRVGAGGPQRIGGDVVDGAENIMKNNGTYIFEWLPDAASKVSIIYSVYEEAI